MGRKGLDEPVGDLVDLAHAVDPDEQAHLVVVVAERRGLAVVDRLALADDVLGVVGATLGLRPLEQALDDDAIVERLLKRASSRWPWRSSIASRASTWPAVRG